MKVLLKIIDLIGGLFLIFAGIFFLYLYVCLKAKADNWFIMFAMFLFLLGLGIAATLFGVRRLYFAIKGNGPS